ncbi:DNA polymerase-like protein [Amaricoccus sp. HAR-UPW-R2A-40]|nr:DNA polymerase-like protein [Amaricoccus sp. HAR-UPW-R2A-40]
MTLELFQPTPSYLIEGVGPYTIRCAYRHAEDLQVFVWDDGVLTELALGADYTVLPTQAPIRRLVSCAEAMEARDGRLLTTAGIVLVRQMPGSAKGMLFVTIEDETRVANLVIWRKLYARQRRVILGARMLGVQGRVQREGAVVHLIANQLTDLSEELAAIGAQEGAFPLPHGRGDEFHHGGPGRDPRDMPKPRDLPDPHGRIDQLRVKPRDFR